MKLLTKGNERLLFGICSGIGKYINVDPTVVRLLWIFGTVVTGVLPGIVAYVIAWVIIPEPASRK